MIVGITGRKGVGKSTAAGRLCSMGFALVSFATPIKSMVAVFLRDYGLTDDSIMYYSTQFKERPIPGLNVSYRHLCQTLGTEWGRAYVGLDVWLLLAAARMAAYPIEQDFLFDDVRFENEANWIRSQGGLILHISRDTGLTDSHASEAGVVFYEGDAAIDNCESVGGLLDRVVTIVLRHGEKMASYAHANG